MMAVACPAEPCDFSGTLDQVEGHLGGVCDSPHDGVVVADLMESLHGEGSDGVPVGLLVGVVLVGIVGWWLLQSQSTDDEEDGEASAGVSTGREVATVA